MIRSEVKGLGKAYAQLDSTDGNVVEELVSSLEANDLIAIHEWYQNHKDAKRHPHFAAMTFAYNLPECHHFL